MFVKNLEKALPTPEIQIMQNTEVIVFYNGASHHPGTR